MATNKSTSKAGRKAKQNFVRWFAGVVHEVVPRYSRAECLEAARWFLFYRQYPHLMPLRARAAAAGLL